MLATGTVFAALAFAVPAGASTPLGDDVRISEIGGDTATDRSPNRNAIASGRSRNLACASSCRYYFGGNDDA